MKKIIYICFVMSFAIHAVGERDLVSLQQYVANLPEDVMSKNSDWEKPDYDHIYKRFRSSWVDKTLDFFNLIKSNPWDLENIVPLMQNVITDRKDFVEKDAYAVQIVARPETKFVIWGDLFGAVHSLVRDLGHLHEQGVIDENLNIQGSDYYFVFLGNAIDRSPYSLEMLHVILTLMERNPGRVFYLKGGHEADNYWMNFNLRSEIVIYSAKGIFPSTDSAMLEQLVRKIFHSLPGALYINQKDSSSDVIALSNSLENYQLDESSSERFFAREVNTVNYPLVSSTANTIRYHIVGLIKGGQGIKTPVASRGLTMTEPYKGITTWSVISCPTLIYQKFFEMFYDSFVVLTLGDRSSQAVLNLFYQDVRSKQGFNKAGAMNIVTGASVAQPGQKEVYRLGSTMDLSKGLAYMGQDVRFSLFQLIDQSNKNNYLPGKFIELHILDDEYLARLAIKNVQKLINDYKTDTILLPVGSPTLESYFELVKEGKIGVFFPITGSPSYRKAEVKNIVHWRASYQDEARALIEYMISQNGAKKFAFFYQNDSYGQGPLEAVHELLKEKGITDWVDVPYSKTALNFDDAAAAIRKSQPDAIGLFSISGATQELFRSLGVEFLFNAKLFGISFLADDSFRGFIKDFGIRVIFSQVVPNPRTSNLEIVRDFRAFMDKNSHPYDVFSLESYICTSLYLNVLKSFQGVATLKDVIATFESYKDFKYKDLILTFNPQGRDLGQGVWLEIDADNWVEYKNKTPVSLPDKSIPGK